MTKEQLLAKLAELVAHIEDPKLGTHFESHEYADRLLLEFINDPAITEAYDRIEKYYTDE